MALLVAAFFPLQLDSFQANRIRQSVFNFCTACVASLQSELLNVKYFKFQVTIRNNPETFFLSLCCLMKRQGSSDNCYYIMSCSVCFDTLQWCLLVNIFPPPPPWSRYCISLTLWLSTLCSAPHLESVPSALLRCHVISHCELAITLKLFKLNRPCFRIHLWGPKNERS